MTRVESHQRMFYGMVAVRVILVDAPGPFAMSEGDRRRYLGYCLDAGRLLHRLGRDWALAQDPQVLHPIALTAFVPGKLTVAMPTTPIPPLTGDTQADIKALEPYFVSAVASALGIAVPADADAEAIRNLIADDADYLQDQKLFGQEPSDVLTLILTTLPLGWFGYARTAEGVAFVQINTSRFASIDRVIAHELAHLFGALDEYDAPAQHYHCSAGDRGGALGFGNDNCVNGGSTNVPCLMRQNSPVLCPATPIHLGWQDNDADGTMDLAVPPVLRSVDPVTLTGDRWVELTGDGLQFATRVWFGQDEAAGAALLSNGNLSAKAPPGLGPGPIDVAVQTIAGFSRPGDVVVFEP